MTRPSASIAALLAAIWIPAAAQIPEPPLQTAAIAWDRGDYVAALTAYLRMLDTSPSPETFDAIATQTGELFHTLELTPDGAAPLFSPDGRHLTYETGSLISRRTRLLATAAPTQVLAEVEGFGAAFSPDGKSLGYLKLSPSGDLIALQAAVDTAPQAQRAQTLAALNDRIGRDALIVVRDIASGRETTVDAGPLRKASLSLGAAGIVVFAGTAQGETAQIYSVVPGQPPVVRTPGAGEKIPVSMNSEGTALLFTVRAPGAGRGGGGGAAGAGGGAAGAGAGGAGAGGGGRGGPATPMTFGVLPLPGGAPAMVAGSAPSFSADGRSFVYVSRDASQYSVMAAAVSAPGAATTVRRGADRVDAPALSPDGARVIFQMMPKEDWELYVVNRDGTGETRLSREIQHDVLPRFLSPQRALATVGEARHRRSYLYDIATRTRTRLFHNNTVRTIAPEYAWVPSADGNRILISAERDGDTVSPERGVYLVDLTRRITLDDLRARLRASLAAEQALRAAATKMYAPIAPAVRTVVDAASVERVYAYEKALFDFDSKHITQPGNRLASDYLFNAYKSFGYEPEYQWFEGRGALGGKTANVLATLKGTVNPELVYVVSSHYDSVATGPGADDDTSGTAALLEAARIMAQHPQPATIVFASFSGEEAGLLGSREWVRQAVANKVKLVGALNNDMVGWANDHRLDNTIRYSNVGIRDIQHAAAMLFTRMITYDALYYKSTDAAAYYEAYGDIVGGIGSYPVLGNPHYHQSHDLLDTINHQLVTEVAKTTAATLMLLASSPSRVANLEVASFAGGTAALRWTPSPENGVTGYIVSYTAGPDGTQQQVRVATPAATLQGMAAGARVSVKAVNGSGREGWDWATVVVK